MTQALEKLRRMGLTELAFADVGTHFDFDGVDFDLSAVTVRTSGRSSDGQGFRRAVLEIPTGPSGLLFGRRSARRYTFQFGRRGKGCGELRQTPGIRESWGTALAVRNR